MKRHLLSERRVGGPMLLLAHHIDFQGAELVYRGALRLNAGCLRETESYKGAR